MVNSLLTGEQVRLTAIAERVLSAMVRLYEDSSFLRLYDAKPAAPHSQVRIREWMKEASLRCFRFAIRPVSLPCIKEKASGQRHCNCYGFCLQ